MTSTLQGVAVGRATGVPDSVFSQILKRSLRESLTHPEGCTTWLRGIYRPFGSIQGQLRAFSYVRTHNQGLHCLCLGLRLLFTLSTPCVQKRLNLPCSRQLQCRRSLLMVATCVWSPLVRHSNHACNYAVSAPELCRRHAGKGMLRSFAPRSSP
jgi:hypothetical protein